MKTLKTSIVLLILTLCSLTSIGQVNLLGKWKANCFFDRNKDGSLTFCSICPTSLIDNKLKVSEFEMEFNDQTLKILINGVTTTINYTLENETLSFVCQKVPYTFKIMSGTLENTYILKDPNRGGLLLLSK